MRRFSLTWQDVSCQMCTLLHCVIFNWHCNADMKARLNAAGYFLLQMSLFLRKRGAGQFCVIFLNSRLTRFGKASLFRSRLFADAPMGVLRHDRQLVCIHKTCLDVHARSWPIIACMHPSDHFRMMFARTSEMPVIFYCSQGLSSSYYYPASPLANMAGH